MHYGQTSALALSLAVALATSAAAQTEAGVFYGHAYYMGDLQPVTKFYPLPLGNGHRAFGLYGRHFFTERLAVTASGTGMFIEGADNRREGSRMRNLSFSTRIYELGIGGEYYPLSAERAISPYLSFGGAYYRFNPVTEFEGRTVALRDLGTEGQGSPGYGPRYSLNRFAVPLGGGVRVALGRSWVVSLETKIRMTFFDHLDDVSGGYVNYYELVEARGSLAAALSNRTHELTGGEPLDLETGTPRGNPANFDYYLTAGLTIGYRLGSGAFGSGGGTANRYNKCYRF